MAPLTSREECSSFGRGSFVKPSQIEPPMPTAQVNLALASRKETSLARLETLASVERTVNIAEGDVTVRTRKVACRVVGAVTG